MAGKRLGGILLAKSAAAATSNKRFRYLDFDNFPSLAGDPPLLERLIVSYQTIFGDPNGWGEHYSRDEVLQKLANELTGAAALRIGLDSNDEVAGFCWAQVLNVDEIADAIGTIKYYRSIGSPDVTVHLQERFGDRRVIYLHELGIDGHYRGRVPLTQLVYPILDTLAQRAALDTVLFWSVADTNVSRLAKRALFHRILALDEMRFYCGDLWASKTRPGRVTAGQENAE